LHNLVNARFDRLLFGQHIAQQGYGFNLAMQPAQKRYRFIKNPIGARYGNHQGNPLCDVRFDNSGMANRKAKQNKDNRQQNGKGEIVYVERYSAGLDLRPEKNPCGGYGTQIIHRNQKNIYGSSGFDELK
jgi:hypothetical protein